MNERLLTDTQIQEAMTKGEKQKLTDQKTKLGRLPTLYVYRLRAIREAQDTLTLKAVGEWLERIESKVDWLDGQISRGFPIREQDIESLKKGELPE